MPCHAHSAAALTQVLSCGCEGYLSTCFVVGGIRGRVRVQVALATQVYDYVDQRIRRLDKDMKACDAEISRERVKLGLPVS